MAPMTTEDAGMWLDLKPGTVVKWIESGKLRAVKHGRMWFIAPEEVARAARARRPRQGGRPPRSLAERFWEKADRSGGPDACWPWMGPLEHDGYGRFQTSTNGHAQKMRANRMAWELTYGPIPPDQQVCHHCDNPPCTNPTHYFLGTGRDNSSDMVAKDRQARGMRNAAAKLTVDQVRDIRSRDYSRHGTQAAVAREFGVTGTLIRTIRKGTIWRHLEMSP